MEKSKEWMRGYLTAKQEIKEKNLEWLKPAKYAVTEPFSKLKDKVTEEHAELTLAIKEYCRKPTVPNKIHMLTEAMDIQLACETFIRGLWFDDKEIKMIQGQVLYGNAFAGYYGNNGRMFYVFEDGEPFMMCPTFAMMQDVIGRAIVLDRKSGKKHKYSYIEFEQKKDAVYFDGECGF